MSMQYQAGKWWEERKVAIRGFLVDPIPNSPKELHMSCMADSKENYWRDLEINRGNRVFLVHAVKMKKHLQLLVHLHVLMLTCLNVSLGTALAWYFFKYSSQEKSSSSSSSDPVIKNDIHITAMTVWPLPFTPWHQYLYAPACSSYISCRARMEN